MKFIFASDSFKGSLTSEKINCILEEEAHKIFPDAVCIGVPAADGGEGTVDAVVCAAGGVYEKAAVRGPLFEKREAVYGVLSGNRAVIEMAAASGLPLVPAEKRNPWNTTSYGTGELIRHALDRGCREIAIAIGGSATNDGGMGAMRALGVRFLDDGGHELAGTGSDLERVERIDLSGLHPAVCETEFMVMCDVNNPLLGKSGATYTFGPQKGADEAMLEKLEAGMCHYAGILREQLGTDPSKMPGAGAAGGLGAALMVFLNAKLQSGIETVLDLIGFDALLEGADLVITGEGRMDWQSAHGKVPAGIGSRCRKKGVPAVAIVGGLGKGAEDIYAHGIESMMTTVNGIMPLKEAMEQAESLYRDAAERTFRLLRTGMELRKK